ncbi:MAG: trypsin-like peptidase domain-containing protein [Phycisphaerales bacterium]|nr:trypsin-like peptidase domain-containing protein [Phycisphaerales bacterium]
MSFDAYRHLAFPAALITTSALAIVGIPHLIDQAEGHRDRVQVHRASRLLASGMDADVLQQFSNATRQIARRVGPSVVHVSSAQIIQRGPHSGLELVGSGSGWLWDEQGHVVTNWHVVEGASRVDVQLHDGEVRSAELIGADPLTDVALLRIPPGGLVSATRAPDFREVEQGDLVFAFGSPLDFRFSMSSGLVSGLGRFAGIIGSFRRPGYEDFIQVDAAINPGNSGGPLTDARGRVIGMNTAIATRDEGIDGTGRFNGIGLAIPLPMIESVVTQLLETGDVQKGYLGVIIAEPEQPTRRLGGPDAAQGVLVGSRQAEGLTPGDIILRCGDSRVHSEAELYAAIEADEDGVVELFVVRHDVPDQRTLEVALPETPWPETFFDSTEPLHLFLRQYDAPPGGVIVAFCEPGSPAAECGLRVGDLILQIDGRSIRSLPQLRSSVSSVPPGNQVKIKCWRWSQPTITSTRTATLIVHPDL